MTFPKKQYVVARVRGNRTDYFYGTKLGTIVTDHIKVGDEFSYTTLLAQPWKNGTRTSERSYAS